LSGTALIRPLQRVLLARFFADPCYLLAINFFGTMKSAIFRFMEASCSLFPRRWLQLIKRYSFSFKSFTW
jgi:hypothetical protein